MEPLTERESELCGVVAEKAVDLMYKDINRLNRSADSCIASAESCLTAAQKCDQSTAAMQGAMCMFVAALATQRHIDVRELLAFYDRSLEQQFPANGPEPPFPYLAIRAQLSAALD